VRWAGKAGLGGNFGHRQIGSLQQGLMQFDAPEQYTRRLPFRLPVRLLSAVKPGPVCFRGSLKTYSANMIFSKENE
jgi:hypothetical protein